MLSRSRLLICEQRGNVVINFSWAQCVARPPQVQVGCGASLAPATEAVTGICTNNIGIFVPETAEKYNR